MNVAETIRQQIGNAALFLIGAKNFMKGTDSNGNEYLYFKIMRNVKKVKYIQIALDAARDTYIFKTLNQKGETLNTIEGVYFDQLIPVIESETSLYCHL